MQLRSLAAVACMATASVPCLSLGVEAETLRDKLDAKRQAMECPGALVGIYPDDGEPERYALGESDVDTHAPMTLEMHMRVGSVTKPFLGTVVLQLVDEGKLSLDDRVTKYVPDVPSGDLITLRMMGANRSGLFNTIENKFFQRAIMREPEKQWTATEILASNQGYSRYNVPGEEWRYSNTNAVLLGMCVEKVAGRPFAGEIQRRVCEPLGLVHTKILDASELPDPHPSAYRNGYPDKVIGYGDVFYHVSNYSASWTNAAGNMGSTLDDLGKAARPLATGALLSDAGKRALHDWIPTGYDGVDYGFCLYRRDGGLGHTGDVPGFNAWMVYYPDLKASVVALTNLSNNKDRQTMPADELAKIVVEELRARKK